MGRLGRETMRVGEGLSGQGRGGSVGSAASERACREPSFALCVSEGRVSEGACACRSVRC